jgi:hypothetical protein
MKYDSLIFMDSHFAGTMDFDLEHINEPMRAIHCHRHCEERGDAAIHAASELPRAGGHRLRRVLPMIPSPAGRA